MIGIYEHRRWFRRHHETAFEVKKEGVFYNQRLYPWDDIKDIRRYRAAGSAGHGALLFAGGVKCIVNLNTFRRKDEENQISFLGSNHAFEQLRKYLVKQKMDSLRNPRMDALDAELKRLQAQLTSTTKEDEVIQITEVIQRVSAEYLKMNDEYIEKIKSKAVQVKPNRWLMSLAAVLIAAVVLWLNYVKP